MKKLTLCLLALCLLLPLVACSETTEDGYTIPDGWQLISNDNVDYYMVVPEDWITDLNTGVISAKCSTVDPTNVTVITQELKTGLTLDEYWEQYGVKNASLLGEVAFYTEGASKMLHRAGDRTVPAKRYTYTATLEDMVYVFDQVVCICDNYVFLITMTATEENYTDMHISEFEDMIDHFLIRI